MEHGHHYENSINGEEEFEAIHHVKKTRTQTILSALLLGMEVKLGDHIYRLFESIDGGYTPGIVQDGKLICGMPDLSVTAFSAMCEKIPEEEFQSIEANCMFNMVKQKPTGGNL